MTKSKTLPDIPLDRSFSIRPKQIYVAMNEIEIFGTFSGLMINRNKTEGLWIGKLKHSKDKLDKNFQRKSHFLFFSH